MTVLMAQSWRDNINHATKTERTTRCGKRITDAWWATYEVSEQKLRNAVCCISCRVAIGTLPRDWREVAEMQEQAAEQHPAGGEE